MTQHNNILFDVQRQVADIVRADSQLSSIAWLEENRRDLEFEMKNALGKQGLVGIILTPTAEYIGDYSNKTLAWELNPLEIDVIENVPVARGVNNDLSCTGQDLAIRLFDVLCPQRNNQREGAISPIAYEQGEDNSLIVNRCTFKCYVTDYYTADNEDTVVTYIDGTVKVLSIVGEIGRYTVPNKSSMSKIDVGIDVTSIGYYAFDNCNSLTSVFIPDTVTSIGDCAFMGCHYITQIDLPDSISSIGHTAFSSCERLTSVVLPRHVTELKQNAFSNCYALSSIQLPADVSRISNYAFRNCTSLTAIDIPDNEDVYGQFGFGYQVFQGCSSLLSVHLPEATTVIQRQMFDGCTSLSSVDMPPSLRIISMSAFNDCSSLTSLVISNELTSIGQDAFKGCDSLTSVTLDGKTKAEVKAMTWYPWQLNKGTTIHCTDGDIVLGVETTFKYTESSGLPDKEVYIVGAMTNLDIPNIRDVEEVYVGTGVTSISTGTFTQCTNLVKADIADTVRYLDGSTFFLCSNLTEVTIGSGVQQIGQNAFRLCSSLTDVTFRGKTISQVQNITDYPWYIQEGATIHCTDGDIVV